MDAAYRVFSENGYANASLREIARLCGVTHATLLHHFPRKVELLTATLAKRDAQFPQDLVSSELTTVLADMVAGARDNDGQPGLVHTFTRVSAEAADPHHPAHAYFERRTLNFITMLSAPVQRALDDGSLTSDASAEEIATNIMALWDGLQLIAPLSPTPISIADQLQIAFEALLGRPLDVPSAALPRHDLRSASEASTSA
ncbi:MAG: TetR/AcrR family transcriptional regulator [Propionibacteriaceae bacterium]|nr:TetR/AcrR family transcriptional regulator [Propionibacteriaceae bacterium]